MSNSIKSLNSLKLILAGDERVGKSSFVDSLKTGKFYSEYIPTNGIAINNISINTNLGIYSFDVLEISSSSDESESILEYYREAHCAIIMFDLTNTSGTVPLKKYYDGIRSINHNIPIVFIGNKSDECGKVVPRYYLRDILLKSDNCDDNAYFTSYDVSSKGGIGWTRPFYNLLKRITGVINVIILERESPILIDDSNVRQIDDQTYQLTAKPTDKPTDKTTDKQTDKPTDKPTDKTILPTEHQHCLDLPKDSCNNVANLTSLMSLKNSIIMDIVSKHKERTSSFFCYSLLVLAHPSIISNVVKQIVKNTKKVIGSHVPLNYKGTTNFGVGFIEYNSTKATRTAMANDIIKSSEKEYSFSVEECDIHGLTEKLLVSLVVNDDVFEYAETRMITIKGIPIISNTDTNISKILLLKQTLHTMFLKYGNIVHSYLPLNDDKKSTSDHYVIEYDNNVNVQIVINNENGKHFGENLLTVSKFNNTI